MIEREQFIDVEGDAMRTFIAAPDEGRRAAVVVVLMDAAGVRDALKDVARRLAGEGYYAMLPDLYHRQGEALSFDPWKIAAGDDAELKAVVATMGELSDEMAVDDVVGVIDHVRHDDLADATRIGVLGFCMGGRFALRAMARLRERLKVGAVIHPSFIVTEQDNSPHRELDHVNGSLYFAFGEADRITDSSVVPAAIRDALSEAPVDYKIDVLPGGEHGFMLAGPAFLKSASEVAWKGTLEAFHGALMT